MDNKSIRKAERPCSFSVIFGSKLGRMVEKYDHNKIERVILVKKKLIIGLCGAVVLALGLLNVHAEEKAGQWKQAFQVEAKHSTYYAGFLNDTQGITVSYGGEVHFSKDAGKTWPRAINNSWCRFGLEIVDANVAFHCGNKGHVRMSVDGGETWDEVADFGDMEPDQCRFLSFADPKTGWIASPFRIAATHDGAQSWTEFDMPEASKNIAAINLRTANDGYILDLSGKLFMTGDAGKTWSERMVPLNGLVLQTLKCPTAAMRFSDANHGTVVVASTGKILSFLTADGGKTWTKSVVSDKLFGFIFLTKDGKTLTITSKLGNLSDREGVTLTVFHLQ